MCDALTGYDYVTGLGTPQAKVLIPALAARPDRGAASSRLELFRASRFPFTAHSCRTSLHLYSHPTKSQRQRRRRDITEPRGSGGKNRKERPSAVGATQPLLRSAQTPARYACATSLRCRRLIAAVVYSFLRRGHSESQSASPQIQPRHRSIPNEATIAGHEVWRHICRRCLVHRRVAEIVAKPRAKASLSWSCSAMSGVTNTLIEAATRSEAGDRDQRSTCLKSSAQAARRSP